MSTCCVPCRPGGAGGVAGPSSLASPVRREAEGGHAGHKRCWEGWEEGDSLAQEVGEWSRWGRTNIEDNGNLLALSSLSPVPAGEALGCVFSSSSCC